MKKEKSRKWIKYIIIIIVILAIVAGTVIFFLKNRKKVEVPVYSVRDIGSEDYWENSSTSQGRIQEDKMQSVYLSSTQKVEKIAVKEGQTVKAGDVLLKYNTTLSNLELERKQIDIKKMELELDKAKKELAQIQTYKPGVPTYGSLPVEQPPAEEIPEVNKEEKKLEKPLPELLPGENEITPAPLTGAGTLEKPYLFIWSKNKEYEKTFIESLINRAGASKTEVIAVFMIRENDSQSGDFISSSKIKFVKKDDDYTFSILGTYAGEENDPLYTIKENNNQNTVQEPEEIPEVGPIYTAIELQKMIIDKEKEISDISLNIKIAQNEYKVLKEELDSTTVYSKLDGVVKTVLSVDDENAKTKPIIVVSSGGGYYIQGRVGELDLNNIKIGQKVNVQAFESGTSGEGVIEKISDYPSAENYYNGMGNSNVSYYAYTVRIGEESNFKSGEYAMLNLVSEQETSNSLYITSAFVLSENGKNYAYVVGENDKLEKRELNIGKNRYGMVEVRGGISIDDRIAFPYGKNIKNGASVTDGSLEDLYSGM